MKIETGVMIMKDGKAWGVIHEDGHSTSYGWMDPESAPIHKPEFVKKPTDVTWARSRHVKELETGKVVHVKRITNVVIMAENKNNE